MYSTMNDLKRKSTSNITEPRYYTRKQRKIADKKDKQNKSTLKTVFSKVNTDIENGRSIYQIKDTKELPSNLATQLNDDDTQHTTVNDDILFSQIPEFTDKDIAELINQTDLDLLFSENDTIDSAVETFGSATTHDIPIISTTDQSFDQSITVPVDETTESSRTRLSTCPIDGPIDLSIKRNGVQNSTTTLKPQMPPSSSSLSWTTTLKRQMPPSSSSLSRVDAYFKVMRYRREYGIPSASSATNRVDQRRNCMAVNKRSSTTDFSKPTRINETITSNKNTDIERSSLTSRDNPKILKPPVRLLEEILGLQGLRPIYDIKPISADPKKAVFQCRAWIATQNAYGSGMSTNEAKNHAATSLLEKLISNKYFGNVIGQLQEFCMSRGWPLPKYVDELDMVRMNADGFIVSCSVRKQKEYGQGKNKKMAKLFAAYKTWLKVSAPK